VPEKGDVLHVPAPLIDLTRPGGVGLDDLHGLLESQDRVDELKLPVWGSVMSRVIESGEEGTSDRILDIRVERASGFSLFAQ
jgi:hypothetical protein